MVLAVISAFKVQSLVLLINTISTKVTAGSTVKRKEDLFQSGDLAPLLIFMISY